LKHNRKNKSKATKGPGYEYWGTRDAKEMREPGKSTKVLTHRRERRKNRVHVHMEASSADVCLATMESARQHNMPLHSRMRDIETDFFPWTSSGRIGGAQLTEYVETCRQHFFELHLRTQNGEPL
jgi:hypothetical protein